MEFSLHAHGFDYAVVSDPNERFDLTDKISLWDAGSVV